MLESSTTRDRQSGAVLTEYAIAVVILLPIFVAIAISLHFAAGERAEDSATTVRNVTPPSTRILELAGGDPDPSVVDDAGVNLSRASRR